MKAKKLHILIALILGVGLITVASVSAQNKPTVYTVNAVANQAVAVQGSLKNGVKLKSLDWAWMSSNACFPATQSAKFTGNHVFYVVELPPRSVMNITVKPKSDGTNLSVYGYQIAAGKIILPEDLQSSVTCEASHKSDYPIRGKTETGARSMRFNAIGNPYNVVIGVAGANNLTEGDFTLEIALKQ
jgi:hypothetical protein